MDILTYEYILEYLMKLANNDICCVFFLGPFFDIGDQVYSKISSFRLKIHNHIKNGRIIKRIYNLQCFHCIDTQRPFHLNNGSKKDILYYLKHCNRNKFHEHVVPLSLFKSSRLRPLLPANRFSIAPLRANTYYYSTKCGNMIPKTWRLYPFKHIILENIIKNRLLVINGDASLEKSTAVPLIIVENFVANNLYCKILCVESDNLIAITNSNFIADHLNERPGNRVGFQVYLQSRVCDNTNIIYTTAAFFLRVLMGQESKDSFCYITHVIVSDAYLHHAYKDIFMKELKIVLPHYPHLKIILLSDSSDNKHFVSYFEEGEELCIDIELHNLNVYHLEDITVMIKRNESQTTSLMDDTFSCIIKVDCKILDIALENYNAQGNETEWNNLINLVNRRKMSANHCHSKYGYSLLIAAVKHDNPLHVTQILTNEHANLLYDEKMNALEYAISINSYNCIKALTENINNVKNEIQPSPIDFDLIIKLVHFIVTHFQFGNILVFLPSYDHMLKLKYNILKTQFLGKIQLGTCIHMLHADMQPEQLQQILFEKDKIILATEMAEFVSFLNDISYVIDTCQVYKEKYCSEFKCNESKTAWVSREGLKRRSLIASRYRDGHCFRLISENTINFLPETCLPELHYMPMNRILLTVKLLSPGCAVAQYFQDTITKPPPKHIENSIKFLKDIEVLDSTLQVTWLGCRLIDVPINFELGKSLVMSILLKCLDPVLTIVSFLTYSSSFDLIKQKMSGINLNYCYWVDETFSDHLEFLQLYQTWQNKKQTKTEGDIISDEETFILNGILESVCEIRTNLVGALRSSLLIHNKGLLNMHSNNLNANNWAIIKAAIAAGLYPKLCITNSIGIKSKSTKLYIDGQSNLHPTKIKKVASSPLSNWIVFYNESSRIMYNSISNCTLISSATVALFAGRIEFNPKNLFFTKDQCGYFIDENIWLITDIQSALLALKLRQMFSIAYMNYLQNCVDIEKWKKPSNTPQIFDVISKILLEEDKSAGFLQPTRVGHRPKAISNKFTNEYVFVSDCNKINLKSQSNKLIQAHLNYDFLDKEYFLINIFDSDKSFKSFFKLSGKNILNDLNLKIVSEVASKENLVYVLVCSATQRRITNIALIKCEEDIFLLKNCFQLNIPLHEVIISCTSLEVSLPSFLPDAMLHKIDKTTGDIILDLWQ